MAKIITISLLLLAFAGCSSNNTDQSAAAGEPVPSFKIESEQPDQINRALTVNIRFPGPTTESQVRLAAEFVIADRKERYSSITVNSFVLSASDKPFGVSQLERGEITHRFNRQSENVRIPTH